MQKAVDAATIAGLALRVELGPTASVGDITPRMDAVLEQNLRSSGVDFISGYTYATSFSPSTVSAGATLAGNIDLFLMDILPLWYLGIGEKGNFSYSEGVPLSVLAEGEVAVANIALALDVSGSMRCPVKRKCMQ